MKIASAFLGFVALFLFGAVPAFAEALAPAGKWEVNFGEAGCSALRAYGSGEDRVILRLTPAPFWDVVEVALVWEGKKGGYAFQRDLLLKLDDNEPIKASELIHGFKSARGDMTVHRTNLPIETIVELKRAKQMQFKSKGLDITVTLQQVSQVSDTLEKCIEQLQDRWNIGTLHASRLQTGPTPVQPLRALFSPQDYPADAMYGNDDGTLVFVLLIDEKGKVANCSTARTSGVATLDAQSCFVVIDRGKFKPAVARDGKPAKGVIIQQITWRTGR